MFVNEVTEDSLPVPQPRQPVIMDSSGQHGGLVQKIIDSQKQYSTEGKDSVCFIFCSFFTKGNVFILNID